MNRVIISGINGFVGTNLSSYLRNVQYEVVGLSRADQSSKIESLTWENISAIEELSITTIIHLAGKAHDLKNNNDSAYMAVNTGLSIQLFDVFLKSKANTFIYFSSVKAVADSVDGILREDVNPDPQTTYGKSKFKAEEYLLSQSLPYGKRLIILRPCMIHGPGNKGNLNLLYQFVSKGIPYPLAAFENKRSFLSIDNLCFIVQKIIEDREIPSGVYNVADDEFLSTNEVVQVIAEAMERKPRLWSLAPFLIKKVAWVGDKFGAPFNSETLKKLSENYMVSNYKIKRALQVEKLPVTSKDGLIKTIKSFRDS